MSDRVQLNVDVCDDDGREADVIEISGLISPEETRIAEENIWGHVDGRHHHLRHVAYEDLGTYQGAKDGQLHSDPLQLTQLILAHRILSAQKSTLLRVTEEQHEVLTAEHQHV